MILKGNTEDEPSVVSVHTDKKIKRKGQEVEYYLLLQNLRFNHIESHFLRDGE